MDWHGGEGALLEATTRGCDDIWCVVEQLTVEKRMLPFGLRRLLGATYFEDQCLGEQASMQGYGVELDWLRTWWDWPAWGWWTSGTWKVAAGNTTSRTPRFQSA